MPLGCEGGTGWAAAFVSAALGTADAVPNTGSAREWRQTAPHLISRGGGGGGGRGGGGATTLVTSKSFVPR